MARYIDMDKLSEMIEARAEQLIEGKEALLYVAKWLNLLPSADVAPRAEIAKELLAIIAQRQYLARMKEEGVCDTYHSGYYSGKLLAYEDIKNIIEKKYLEGKTNGN